MAISWGSYENHLRVGIDYVISPSSPSHGDTTVDVTWKFYVGSDGWRWNDTQTMREDADGWGGTNDTFLNDLTTGSMLVGTHTETYSISYSSGSKSASCSISGAYNGATPSKSRTVSLPDRPVATPGAPGLASTTGITSSGATFDWTAPSDNGGASVDAYQLQVDNNSGFTSPTYSNSSLPASPTSKAVTGLSSNTRYYFRVRAHNSAGWGAWSSVGSATTLTGGPSVPTSLALTSRTQTDVSVGWAASATNGGGTVTYTCEIATSSAFTTIVATDTGTDRTATFSTLTPGTTYYIRVRATNTNGTSANSSILTVVTVASSTYNDTGDLVTLLNNLASAVGDKLVHLGAHTHVSKSTADTTAANTVEQIVFDTTETTQGPDNPAFASGALTIQYPGEYLIEFGCPFDNTDTTGRFGMSVHNNGSGIMGGAFAPAGTATVNPNVLTGSRRLEAGDVLTFHIITEGAQTTGTGAYARVVMTGF